MAARVRACQRHVCAVLDLNPFEVHKDMLLSFGTAQRKRHRAESACRALATSFLVDLGPLAKLPPIHTHNARSVRAKLVFELRARALESHRTTSDDVGRAHSATYRCLQACRVQAEPPAPPAEEQEPAPTEAAGSASTSSTLRCRAQKAHSRPCFPEQKDLLVLRRSASLTCMSWKSVFQASSALEPVTW